MAFAQQQTQQLQSVNFSNPQERREFPKGRLELVTVGGLTIGRATFEPGWRWSTHVKPTAGTNSCQEGHFGIGISGRMHVKMDDGTEREFGPGEVVNIPPGHDGWVVGNEPAVFIDITGMENYAKQKKAA